MKVLMMEQGSQEWFEARRGKPTASRFDMILTAAKSLPSAAQTTLIDELISERLSQLDPEGVENFTNRATRHGLNMENEARHAYALDANVSVQKVGLCLTDDERLGASPDALVNAKIGSDGLFVSAEGSLEMKCPLKGEIQLARVRKGVLDNDAKAQCHGILIVTGLPWVDYFSYHPGLPRLRVRVEWDEYTDKLKQEIERFYEKLMAELAKFQPADPAEVSF